MSKHEMTNDQGLRACPFCNYQPDETDIRQLHSGEPALLVCDCGALVPPEKWNNRARTPSPSLPSREAIAVALSAAEKPDGITEHPFAYWELFEIEQFADNFLFLLPVDGTREIAKAAGFTSTDNLMLSEGYVRNDVSSDSGEGGGE